MGLFSKLFSKNNAGYYLALDIGTEVAKALVFEIDVQEKKVTIIGVGKERQKRGNMQSGAVSDISGVIETCQSTINKALKDAKIKKIIQLNYLVFGLLIHITVKTA